VGSAIEEKALGEDIGAMRLDMSMRDVLRDEKTRRHVLGPTVCYNCVCQEKQYQSSKERAEERSGIDVIVDNVRFVLRCCDSSGSREE
jgi:hypothetical protein